MPFTRTLFTTLALALGCAALRADVYDDALAGLKKRTPSAKSGLVMCNPELCQEQLKGLLASAQKAGLEIQLFRVDSPKALDTAKGVLTSWRPDFLVLLAQDPLVGVGTKGAKDLGYRAGMAGVSLVSCGDAAKG